ncbi:hypothetical protein BDR06DRAFT_1013549 [Suillus hirtellus]|nr:hypothetical protein BDR06DRAFT_1013549 [Suillus hirtellus]
MHNGPQTSIGERQPVLGKDTAMALPLNKTRLLYLEALPHNSTTAKSLNPGDHIGTVVQVTIKSRNPSPSKVELAIFAIEQHDITTAIETLLLGHVNGSDSEKLPKRVVIREDRLLGYVLVGGKELHFLFC